MILAVVLATAFLGTNAATRAAHPQCPKSGTTLVSNARVRVWQVRPKSQIDRHYGCVFTVGRIYRLDPPHGQLIAAEQKIKLAGVLVAYQTMDFDLKPYRVVVRNLRTGSTIHSAKANAHGSADGHPGLVRKIVLNRAGSVAWTASVECACEGVDYSAGFEVHKIGHDNRRVVLDRGPAVDALSLRLTADRGRIEWKHNGEVRSASFN